MANFTDTVERLRAEALSKGERELVALLPGRDSRSPETLYVHLREDGAVCALWSPGLAPCPLCGFAPRGAP